MAFEDVTAVLARAPLLHLCEPDALRILAFSGDARRLGSGEILFRRGERSDGGYVILSGAVAVGRPNEAESNVLRVGGLVGRLALFIRSQRPATAVSVEPSAVLRISPTLMVRVLGEFPATAGRIRAALADDMDELAGQLDAISRRFGGAGDGSAPAKS